MMSGVAIITLIRLALVVVLVMVLRLSLRLRLRPRSRLASDNGHSRGNRVVRPHRTKVVNKQGSLGVWPGSQITGHGFKKALVTMEFK